MGEYNSSRILVEERGLCFDYMDERYYDLETNQWLERFVNDDENEVWINEDGTYGLDSEGKEITIIDPFKGEETIWDEDIDQTEFEWSEWL